MSQIVEGAAVKIADAAPDSELDVRLEGVSKRFGDTWALQPTELSIARGEFFSLLGSSGSGKTTTLRIIAGFEEPTSGQVFLQNQNVTVAAPYERNVNTVFQDYALFPHMNVEENVGYGLKVKRVEKRERVRRVAEALEMVRLDGFAKRKPSQLSGGQRQRVALARALVNMPLVLLLDEPLGALDLKLRREMQEELKRIQRDVGITFLYVTHDQEEAMSMSDRVAVMSDGRIEQIGTPTDVYERPGNAFIAGFVGISNLLTGRVVSRSNARYRVDVASAGMVDIDSDVELHDDSEALFAIRPEKITLSADSPQADVNVLRGRVVDVSYGGPFSRYTARVGTVDLAVMEQNQGSGPRWVEGEEVWLQWRPEQTVILPGSQRDLQRGQTAAVPLSRQ